MNLANTGALFYLPNAVSHFPPLFHRANRRPLGLPIESDQEYLADKITPKVSRGRYKSGSFLCADMIYSVHHV
jgi:hypothetical protein